MSSTKGRSGGKQNEFAYYVGAFKNALFHGYGKLTMPNGTYYEGYWKEGRKQGEGLLKEPTEEMAEVDH